MTTNLNVEIHPLKKEVKVTPHVENRLARANLTADVGSTGTRTVMFSREGSLKQSPVIEIDSAYTILTDENVDHLQNKSRELGDLLEIKITDITEGKAAEAKKFPHTLHILKGGIMKDYGSNIEQTVSDVGKASQDSTFINLISNIGIRMLIQQDCTHVRYQTYDIDLTVALTAEDTQNSHKMDKFRNDLAGKYLFELPRIGYSVELNIDKKNIYIEDESLAVLRYWATMNAKNLQEYPNVFVVDGGGRSFDIGYLEDGRLVNAGCKSLPFGGGRLVQETLKDFLSTSTDNFNPSTSMIQKAIKTGMLQRGGIKVPIRNNIHVAKSRMAKDVMKGFNEIFNTNRDISAESVSLVLTTGGCFNETGDEGSEGFVPSLTAYLQAEFKKTSPYTVFDQIKVEHPIALGLVFYRLSQG